jgi:hypothetical protein
VAWVPISDIRGDRVSSLPFSDRAEPLTDDPADWKALTSGVITAAAPLMLRCFDTAVPAGDPRFGRIAAAAWHGTPLHGGIEDIRRRLSQHARRNISISERDGVRVEARTDRDAVHQFHGLHVALRKHKYRLLAQPLDLFDHIWSAFAPGNGIVTMLAHAGDELIAGAVFLAWGSTWYYKFGASRHDHLALRPNDAIFWAGIRWAVEQEARLVDWGLSDLDQPGLVSYKRKWATEERQIVTLRAGGEHARSHAEAGPMLGEAGRGAALPLLLLSALAGRPRGVLPHGLITDSPVAANSSNSAADLATSESIPAGSPAPATIWGSCGNRNIKPAAVNAPAMAHLASTHQCRSRPHGVDNARISPLISEENTTGTSTQQAITAVAVAIPARTAMLALDIPVISRATSAPSSPTHPTDVVT